MTVRLEGQVLFGGRALFAPVRLELAAGRWTALLGPSGAGKSTLLRLLAGLPVAGRFEGRVYSPFPVALMAQDAALLPWLTLRGNVGLGARLRGEAVDRQRIDALLDAVGLAARADSYPLALSGGQMQRVALARTLAEDRPVVLLDEPFSALDPRTRLAMQDLAVRLLAGRTVLMVTHDPAEALRVADRVLLLGRDGLEEVAVPTGAVPRGPADPGLLACQGALLQRLMAGAA